MPTYRKEGLIQISTTGAKHFNRKKMIQAERYLNTEIHRIMLEKFQYSITFHLLELTDAERSEAVKFYDTYLGLNI